MCVCVCIRISTSERETKKKKKSVISRWHLFPETNALEECNEQVKDYYVSVPAIRKEVGIETRPRQLTEVRRRRQNSCGRSTSINGIHNIHNMDVVYKFCIPNLQIKRFFFLKSDFQQWQKLLSANSATAKHDWPFLISLFGSVD